MAEAGYFDKVRDSLPDNVDPRLDNRTGNDRPPVERDPAVPQQVDGPDLMHQAEHAEAVAALAAKADAGERKGMFSPGQHSLGQDEERGGNDAGVADPHPYDGNYSTDPQDAANVSDVVAASKEQAEEHAKDAKQAAEGDEGSTSAATDAGVSPENRGTSGGVSSRDTETASSAPGESRERTAAKKVSSPSTAKDGK